jgi:anti-anti-sigma factor
MAKQLRENRLVLEGEWDLDRKDELATLLERLTKDRPATIDVRGVSYADSTMLSLLARLALRFEGVAITLVAPQPQVLRVLKIANFDKLFQIVEGASDR